MATAVFGGSGRIGEAVVRRLAADRPVRFVYHSNRDAANNLVSSLSASGRDVTAEQVDVRDAGAVDAFLRSVPDLDAIVSVNGSPFPVAPLHEIDEADFRRIVDVDLFGTFHIMKTGTALLAERGGGPMVFFLTAAILRTARWDAMSSVPKAAMASMIRQLARDAGGSNIRVNGIAPGVVDTDKVADIASLPRYKRELIETFKQDTALNRFNNLDGLAELTAFLLSEPARDISGQIIGADGGYSA